MDDEEYDEDVEYVPRKDKTPVKGIVKGLGIMVLVVTGLWLVNQGWGDTSMMVGGFMLLCIGSTLMNVRGRRKKKVKHVYSIHACSACVLRELHDFKDGEFVFKPLGPCPRCDDGHLFVEQVFAVHKEDGDRVKMVPPGAAAGPVD